jgi:hypothetical protein
VICQDPQQQKGNIMTKPTLSDLEAAHRERVMDGTFPQDTESSASRQHYIDTGEYLPALPAEWAVVIVDDEEYNRDPGAHVGWSDEENAEYVKEFEDGKLSAYRIMIVERDDEGRIHPYAPNVLASLGGVDVDIDEYGTQDGTYDSFDEIRHDYLRSVAIELLSDAQDAADDAPEFSRNQVRAVVNELLSSRDESYMLSGDTDEYGPDDSDGYENLGAAHAFQASAFILAERLLGEKLQPTI